MANEEVKNDYDKAIKRLKSGISSMDVSKKSIGLRKDYYLVKAGDCRIVVQQKDDGIIDILGVADRGNKSNVPSWKKVMKKLYNLDLQYVT